MLNLQRKCFNFLPKMHIFAIKNVMCVQVNVCEYEYKYNSMCVCIPDIRVYKNSRTNTRMCTQSCTHEYMNIKVYAHTHIYVIPISTNANKIVPENRF